MKLLGAFDLLEAITIKPVQFDQPLDAGSHMNDSLAKLTDDYFDYIAECFPVMCASDEFDFLPRAERATHYYDRVDNLDRDAIWQYSSTLRKLLSRCDAMVSNENDPEKMSDLALLKANASGILIELEQKQSWRRNPLLYLKIAFIGLHHALAKPAAGPEERIRRTSARLKAIPGLLKQAVDNMDNVPIIYHQAALAMVQDGRTYLDEIKTDFTGESLRAVNRDLQESHRALEALAHSLRRHPPVPEQPSSLSALEATLKNHFASTRTLSEIFEIAREEWRYSLERLNTLQSEIDPGKTWQALYHGYSLPGTDDKDTFSLYQNEIERLERFFREHGFKGLDLSSSLELCETPTYLRSVRSSASFSAALTADPMEKDVFYITTRIAGQRGDEAADLVKRRLQREYKFLAAHETFPGHHLLDSVRRRLDNPVRRQIESPLFYEGWAYYSESLLTEFGYVDNPMDDLVDCKRRLWRAARCQIDVGLAAGMLSRNEALELVTEAGFSPTEANHQIDHFLLNPGYQLCYSLGRHEIMQLRKTYGSRMDLDHFHKKLLEGGQLPFHLVEKRFDASLNKETGEKP